MVFAGQMDDATFNRDPRTVHDSLAAVGQSSVNLGVVTDRHEDSTLLMTHRILEIGPSSQPPCKRRM